MHWDIDFDMYLLLLPFVWYRSGLNDDFSPPKPTFGRDHGTPANTIEKNNYFFPRNAMMAFCRYFPGELPVYWQMTGTGARYSIFGGGCAINFRNKRY